MKQKLLVLLGVAGLLTSFGLYGIFGPSGNSQVASNDIQGCPASVIRGKTLDPQATGDVAAFRALDMPLDLSDISFLDGDGNPKTLADWQGKIVLFNLWATWCPPCREEMPYFEKLQIEKAGPGFEVVPVSIDLGDASKPKAFYAETGLKTLPFLHDNTMEAFQSLRENAVALGMPTTLLVDRDGCGLGVLNGPAQWAGLDAIRLIDAAIALPDKN